MAKKSDKIKVKQGEQIQYYKNYGAFKKYAEGTELIVEQHPHLKLVATKDYIGTSYKIFITDINSGMLIVETNAENNYLQDLINVIDKLLEIVNTEKYHKEVEKLNNLPTEQEHLSNMSRLSEILNIDIFKDCTYNVGKLSSYISLAKLEEQLILKHSINILGTDKSFKEIIRENFGDEAVELLLNLIKIKK